MSTTKTVVLSKKALEIAIKGINLDMETLALQINQSPEMIEANLSITPDELESVVRAAKIKTRNIKRAEKTVNFEVSEEEGGVGNMFLPNLVIRINQPTVNEVENSNNNIDSTFNEVLEEVIQQHNTVNEVPVLNDNSVTEEGTDLPNL